MATTKSSQDRLGYFSEPSYITNDDPYKTSTIGEFRQVGKSVDNFAGTQLKSYNPNAHKKKQMLSTVTKSKTTASSDGYFEKETRRLFQGEAVTDHYKLRKKEQLKSKEKFVGGAYVVPSPTKKLAGAGSNIGTFHGVHEHMDPREKPSPKKKATPRNFTTQPAKKGTAYGTPGLTLSKMPEYKSSPYNQELLKTQKEAKASKAKHMSTKAFVLNSPKELGTFNKNPYIATKPLPPKKKIPKEKPISVPFYAPKLPSSMAGASKHLGSFDKTFVYKEEGPKKVVKKKEFLKGNWKPQANARGRVTSSIVSMNATRSMTRANYTSHI